MSSERIRNNLIELFDNPRYWRGLIPRVVFWVDPEREFSEVYQALELPEVSRFEISDHNYWQLKQVLHQASPDDRILFYQPMPDPRPEEDWLLDARLYGQVFSAQRAQLIYQEMGFENPDLRPFLKRQTAFFNAQDRLKKLKLLNPEPRIDTTALTIQMMSVLLNLRHGDPLLLIREVLIKGLEAESNPAWEQLLKFFEPQEFYAICQQELGLKTAPNSLTQLFLILAATHVAHQYRGRLPDHWQTWVVTPTVTPFRFVDTWMHDQRVAQSWFDLAKQMAPELQVAACVQEAKPQHYLDCEAFQEFDQGILSWCRDQLLQPHPVYDSILEYLARRQILVNAAQFAPYYLALSAATRLLQLAESLQWESLDLSELFTAYQERHWQLDQAYRQYWTASDQSADTSLLSPLHDRVESAYLGYLQALGQAWGDQIQALPAWPPKHFPQQSNFFNHQVMKRSNQGENRLVVIISDALRYEVAQELQTRLKADLSGQVQLDAVLGVLPSRTHFGMSALLPRPRDTALVLEASGSLRLAGESTEGSERRSKILEQHVKASTALYKFSELQGLSRDEGRNLMREQQIVYIYHDQIDATGDKPANQDKVFAACQDAIEDLYKLIKRLTHWNVTQVLVTADHGFLYQRTDPQEYDKLNLPEQEMLFRKHRVVLATRPVSELGILSLPLQQYELAADLAGPVYALIPRGAQRFRLQGGSTRYMHGGAMPQEICVPVLVYQHVKAALSKTRPKVGLEVLSSHKRITNNVFSLLLFQTEAVGENVRPRNIRVYFESEQGVAITNEKRLSLSSESLHAPDRELRVSLTVSSREVASRMAARLRIIDDDDQNDVVPPDTWTVNLGFINEFGL